MKLSRVCRVIVALAIAFSLAGSSAAQKQAGVIANLPSDLALVPADASLFVAFNFTKYWDSPESELLKRLASAHPVVPTWWLKEMPAAIGLQPENVVRVTMFGDGAVTTSTIATKAPYDRDKVLAVWTPEATQKSAAGKAYFYSEKSKNSVYFADDHTLVIGAGQDMGNFLARPVAPERNASLDIAIDASLHGAPFVVNAGAGTVRSLAAENDLKSTPLAQLTQARAWQIITAIDKHLIIDLRAEFATKDDAKNAVPAMQGIGNSLVGLVPFYKSHMIPFLEGQTPQYPAAKEVAPEMTRALDAAEQGLRAVHTGTVQNAAVARIEINSDKPVTTAVMLLTLMPRAAKTP